MENQDNFTQPQQPQQPGYNMQQDLPNSTAVLVLGILSIVFCWCYGIPGLVMGIIALALSSKSAKLYKENPSFYKEGSYKNMNAGRICAIIGTSLSGLMFVYMILMMVIYGSILTSMPWEMMKEGNY